MNIRQLTHAQGKHRPALVLKRLISWVMVMVLTVSFTLADTLPLMSRSTAFAADYATTLSGKKKPNILMIMGDDIGWFNLSAYNRGMMGYKTPNIDRIAEDGILFTDGYGDQSCTAGRAAFITGQLPIRSGMTKVGIPGAPIGIQKEDPTLADLLKVHGYTSGQFGKNHLGDLDQFLPTNHGFDEFYGNLYHLNAEEEPENDDYDSLNAVFGGKENNPFYPRGVLHSFPATSPTDCESIPTEYVFDEDPEDGVEPSAVEFYYVSNDDLGEPSETYSDAAANIEASTPNTTYLNNGQCVGDTGPLSKKRMETVDQDVTERTIAFMEQAEAKEQPFFAWFNTTRMHVYTHLNQDDNGDGTYGPYGTYDKSLGLEANGLLEHDQAVKQLLDYLDENPMRKRNTIVIYTTDNGAEVFSWPDGGTTPFRNEKNTNWDGGVRVPMMVRWPGHIKAGQVSNDIISLLDWVPTLLAAVGDTNATEDLRCPAIDQAINPGSGSNNRDIRQARRVCENDPPNDYHYLAHLDGYNFLPYLTSMGRKGTQDPAPRREYHYFTDDGYPAGLRYEDWKLVYAEQRGEGFEVWSEPFVNLRVPLLFNLRRDPFEKAYGEADNYTDWRFRRIFLLGPAILVTSQLLNTFQGYPPRQEPASFSVNQVVGDLLQKLKRLYVFN